jgi:hypothetical protein
MPQSVKYFLLSLALLPLLSKAQLSSDFQRQTRFQALSSFSALSVKIPVEMIVDCQEEGLMEITAEAEVFALLDIRQNDGQLSIEAKSGLNPQQSIQIRLGAKGLNRFTSEGKGSFQIRGIDTDQFQLTNPAATVMLEGKVRELRLRVEQGKVEASRLQAELVYANLWGPGLASVNVSGRLVAQVSNEGKLLYSGSAEVRQRTRNGGILISDDPQVSTISERTNAYVDFELYNNATRPINIRIEGPEGKKFGFGLPFAPGQRKGESLPTGTRIYQINPNGQRSLLLEVERVLAGKSIALFEDQL